MDYSNCHRLWIFNWDIWLVYSGRKTNFFRNANQLIFCFFRLISKKMTYSFKNAVYLHVSHLICFQLWLSSRIRLQLASFFIVQDLRKAAVLIYANKQDIKGCLSPAEISQQLNLTAVKDHVWHIQACCGLTGEG